MALLAVGLVVLGPHRLPATARSLAQGLAKARRLADSLTQPVHASLAEPRHHLEQALAEVRGTLHSPLDPIGATSPVDPDPPCETPVAPPAQGRAAADHGFDPANN